MAEAGKERRKLKSVSEVAKEEAARVEEAPTVHGPSEARSATKAASPAAAPALTAPTAATRVEKTRSALGVAAIGMRPAVTPASMIAVGGERRRAVNIAIEAEPGTVMGCWIGEPSRFFISGSAQTPETMRATSATAQKAKRVKRVIRRPCYWMWGDCASAWKVSAHSFVAFTFTR